MKQYRIYKNPAGVIEAVKQGWSWPAFFFSFIWAMVKKMWAIGGATLGGIFFLGFLLGAAVGDDAEAIINLVALILNVVFGVNGNSWRIRNLRSRGYEEVASVSAENAEGAVAIFQREPHGGAD